MELPKKIKRYRERKFTEIRDNYKNYNNANWIWNDIFIEINTSNIKIKEIAKKYNIKYKTLTGRYKKWLKFNKPLTLNIEMRGGNKKIFTDEQEKTLVDYIKDVYIKNGLFFDNECIKIIALKKFKMIYPNDNFSCSDGWVNDFKKKWNLITKRYNYNKVNINIDNIEVNDFLKKCIHIDYIFNKIFVFNLDETFWLLVNNSSTVLGIKRRTQKNFFSNK